MKYFYTFIISLITLTGVAQAQEVQTITIGSDAVEYTETFEDVADAVLYYNGEDLVMTAFDEDKNGAADMWVLFRADRSVSKEISDSDGDGKPDMFFEYDADENLTKKWGDGLKQYEVEKQTTSQDSGVVDYAGDLEDIQKLEGGGGGYGLWILIVLVVGGVYFWRKKKK